MQQQINLYQPISASRDEPFSALMMLSLIAFSCVLMMAFYGMLFWEKNTLQDELTSLKAQFEETNRTVEKLETTVANLTDSKKEQQKLKRLKNVYISKQNALNELSTTVRGNNVGLSPYFSALARKNIESIWFEHIDVYSGGEQMTFHGNTFNAKNIPVFVLSLNDEPAFDGVSFKLFNVHRDEETNTMNFVLQTDADVLQVKK